ncbi:MAG: MBL fold metallo-hydrolase [Chloroflexota bacterium]
MLIRTQDGRAALVDGGSEGTGALHYLQSQGVQTLDLMVATHPHEDHIGGLIEVLQTIPVAEVAANG